MRTPWRTNSPWTNAFPRRLVLPSATACLLATSVAGLAAWYLTRLMGPEPEATLCEGAGLTAAGLYEGRLWQPLTHLWLPGRVSWLLLVELPILFLAGRHLESLVGRRHVLVLFLLAGAAGGAAQVGIVWLIGAPDLPLAGPVAGVTSLYIALSCAIPESDLVPPWSLATDSGRRGPRLKHGALGIVLIAAGGMAVAGMKEASGGPVGSWASWTLPGTRVAAAALVGIFYMRGLGFGRVLRYSLEEQAVWAVAAIHDDESATEPVFAGPMAAAAGKLVVPRITEVDRRMSAKQYISARIDPILDKISLHGIGSLTEEEKRTLLNARDKIGPGR